LFFCFVFVFVFLFFCLWSRNDVLIITNNAWSTGNGTASENLDLGEGSHCCPPKSWRYEKGLRVFCFCFCLLNSESHLLSSTTTTTMTAKTALTMRPQRSPRQPLKPPCRSPLQWLLQWLLLLLLPNLPLL